MFIDLFGLKANYLFISWYGIKGTLMRCLGQILGRQGGDRGRQVDIKYFVWCQRRLLIKTVLHVPFSPIYWLFFLWINLFTLSYLLTVHVEVTTDEVGAFSDAALEEMGFFLCVSVHIDAIWTGPLSTKSSWYLSNLSWEDLIRIYLLVWLGSGFTVGVVLISISLKDIMSCLAILVLINWYWGCLFIFSVQIELL